MQGSLSSAAAVQVTSPHGHVIDDLCGWVTSTVFSVAGQAAPATHMSDTGKIKEQKWFLRRCRRSARNVKGL